MQQPTLTAQFLKFCTHFVEKQFKGFYYSTQESLGHHKRDMVVSHVERACVSLEQSRDQFEDALEKFKTIVPVEEGALEQKYHLLKRQYDFCQNKADEVTHRIKAIEEISAALFKEWEEELKQYNNRSLRSRSRRQLKAAKQQYARLIKNLSKAESKMQPVLAAFYDQVLFLKHNLNAQAIAALQHEFVMIGIDISQLIAVMEKSIAEANQFVSSLVEHKALPKT